MRQLQGRAEVARGERAASERRFAAIDVCRIEMAEVDENVTGRSGLVEILERRGLEIERQAGSLGAFIQNAAIADRDDVCGLFDLGKGQQPRSQLGADAGGIAHGKRDDRTRAVTGSTIGRHVRCPPLHAFDGCHTLFKILHQVFCILYAAFSVDDGEPCLHASIRQC
ncbi:hypothetical protein D3C72_1597540 [compost metagenome]